MTFKACAVTTWLWSCCSQLQEQSHSRQANLTLQMYIVEGSGMPFPLYLNPRVLKVSQNRCVRMFGPSHMCVCSLMLYVYCFEFMLLANRLQNICRMSFPLLLFPPPNHTEQDRANNNPRRCFIFAVHSECWQYYFFPIFYLDCVAVRTNIFFPCTVCLIAR